MGGAGGAGLGWCCANTETAVAQALEAALSRSRDELADRGAISRAWMTQEFLGTMPHRYWRGHTHGLRARQPAGASLSL